VEPTEADIGRPDAGRGWAVNNPQPFDRNAYQGLYKDIHGGPEGPHFQCIQHLAEHGLSKVDHHGRVNAMGAEKAGTGICSGEGGMLPEEQGANSRYLYELA
jgi:hypothetical protein